MIEIQVINYILQSKDWNFVLDNGIDESYFNSCSNQFKFIQDYVNKYSQIPDIVTFFKTFPDFENIQITDSDAYLLDELKYHKIETYSAKMFNQVRDILMKSTISNQDKIDNISGIIKDLNNIMVSSKSMNFVGLDEIVELLKNTFYDRTINLKKNFYSTGIDWLDEVFLGWDKDNDYVVVAGRPGTGKSMLLCALAAEQLKQGKRVAFYEGEMSIAQTMERIVAHLSGLSATDMLKGNTLIQDPYFKAIDELKSYGGCINILTPQNIGKYANCDQLETFCNKINADVLFIDQQSLMNDLEHARVSFEKAGNVSRQIKALRDKLNIPVITAVQLNRTKTEDGRADTVQIAGSDIIVQDSTKVLILSKHKDKDNVITMNIAKNRSGKSYVDKDFDADFEHCSFKEHYEESSAEGE